MTPLSAAEITALQRADEHLLAALAQIEPATTTEGEPR